MILAMKNKNKRTNIIVPLFKRMIVDTCKLFYAEMKDYNTKYKQARLLSMFINQKTKFIVKNMDEVSKSAEHINMKSPITVNVKTEVLEKL